MAVRPERAASSAASLTRFARSAPENPGVPRATNPRSTFGSIATFATCTLRIASRPRKSGLLTVTCRSNRPGRSSALSRMSARFVAAIRAPARLGTRIKETDPRDPATLLRARRERPCQRTAKQSDELASPHGPCLSARTTRYQIKQCCAAQQDLGADDRFGSKADAARSLGHVRFAPESGQIADVLLGPLCARRRHHSAALAKPGALVRQCGTAAAYRSPRSAAFPNPI